MLTRTTDPPPPGLAPNLPPNLSPNLPPNQSPDLPGSLWQLACREPRLAAAAPALLAGLRPLLPADWLLVRALDPAGTRCETIATAGAGAPGWPPAPAPPALLEWCRTGAPLAGRGTPVIGGLVPPWPGGWLALPLVPADTPPGFLLLGAAAPAAFSPAALVHAAALREPLACALRNDRTLHDRETRCAAAEADRRSLLQRLGRQEIADTIVGEQGGLREVLRQVALVAPSAAPVLILGETGSGKEVIARAIHTRSMRAGGPFLRVNCGAIPPELVDSELFGHERGSFTGASARRQGWFERADGGTLFLDEIGELTPAVQVRLLRILQDGSFERVGGQQPLHADVRIVAATHADLAAMVAGGRFRADLWYRIHVFPLHLPPLRERPEDIPELARHFAARAAARLGLMPCQPDGAALALLLAYPWPGNVRELAAVLERAAILGEGRRLAVAEALGVPGAASGSGRGWEVPPPPSPLPGVVGGAAEPPPPAGAGAASGAPTLDAVLCREIEAALARCLGRIEGPFGAARQLGVNPHTLRARMRRLGIDWARFRPGGTRDQ